MEMELHKMCRICLKNDLLVSIYSPTFLMRPADIIEKLHIFKLNEDDLPKMLCQSCLYRLLDAYNLQQLAETSERRLREFFGTCVNGGSENLLGITNNNHEIEVVRNENGMGMESTVTGTGCGCGSGNGSENGSKSSSNAELRDMHSTLLLTSTTTTSSSAAAALSSGNNQQLFGNYCDDIAVKDATDDLINDVEIDVSSLTRSEPDDEDDEEDEEEEEEEEEEEDTSMSEVFVNEQSNLLDVLNLHTEDKINLEKSSNKKGTSKKQLKTPEKCLECGKLFKYSGYLAVHKRTHTGEKPYKCKLCPRTFTQSSNLLLHERTHTGERRYQCELCANLFTTSSNLKTHRLTHTEQRDFKCTHCTLSFKTLRALRRHEPKHKTHKDIACTLCDKAFVKHCYLNTHMATVHRGIKRHKCHECHKYFGNRSNLLCHLRVHTGERPFQCKLCAWKFNQSSALARHMKKHFKSATKFNPEQVGNDHQLTNNYDFTTSVILDFSINNNKYD